MASCQCGCGQEAGTWTRTDRSRGRVAGEPRRFIQGHNWRGAAQPRVRIPEEYTRIAERALGKSLPPGALVHHVNGDPLDNRNSNLVICQDTAYHSLLHRRTDALKACGHADWNKCKHCQQWGSDVVRAKSSNYHRSCEAAYCKTTPHYQRLRGKEVSQ